MNEFNDKNLLITGGTGSFGQKVLERFARTSVKSIRIFSRDEKKQDDLRRKIAKHYPELNDKVKFYIGDVRDKSSLATAMLGVHYVFHAAALKQVPSCEFFPMEAVKTNIIGTENVLSSAIAAGVEKIICLSTDKAAYPINAMGISKSMMEKVAISMSRTAIESGTTICCTRYGNVLASRGSVVPVWIEQVKKGLPITITNPDMTRFVMSLDEAMDLVLYAFQNGRSGDILVQKAPACTIGILAEAVKLILKKPDYPIRTIGIRHGEKLFETLLTNEECSNAQDLDSFYRVPSDNRTLNYENFFTKGDGSRQGITEFHSSNTMLLSLEEVVDKLKGVDYIKNVLKKN